MFWFASTILLSAFLLFQVQPLIARFILPWFGGGPAIWTTCMLFFQVPLLVGYGYAHWITSQSRRTQMLAHFALLAVALLFLPIGPSDSWKPTDSHLPIPRILLLLTATIGVPYALLSTTGPLLQDWFGRVFPGRSPYRLFALSNAGSLLALLSYPLVFEPNLTLATQTQSWSAAFLVFAGLCGVCAWRAGRIDSIPAGQQPLSQTSNQQASQSSTVTGEHGSGWSASQQPGRGAVARWLLLSLSPSVLLLATTNQISQEVAVVPFLWVLPLTLYLLSFILCFDSDRWYQREVFLGLLIVTSILACVCLLKGVMIALQLQLIVFCAALFVCCMTCHGELARSRPPAEYLTLFYLAVSAGGALGGVLVVLVAPAVTSHFVEYHLGLGGCVLATLMGYFTARDSRLSHGRPRWAWSLLTLLFAGLVGALWTDVGTDDDDVLDVSRNFYGVLHVAQRRDAVGEYVTLTHGRIQHGFQYRSEDLQDLKTSYYGPSSGIGIAIESHPRRLFSTEPMHLGVIGLGTGTLAAYGRPGDQVRFYEINPDVVRLARRHFTYLERSSADVEVVLGDARVRMERELEDGQLQQFDVLAVDAFSSDAIPMHLLTREALQLYLQHLSPDGVLAIHISNRFLDLEPVVWNLARDLGLSASLIEWDNLDSDPAQNVSSWVLVTRDPAFGDRPELSGVISAWRSDMPAILWTDDFGSLWQVLRKPGMKKAIRDLFKLDLDRWLSD